MAAILSQCVNGEWKAILIALNSRKGFSYLPGMGRRYVIVYGFTQTLIYSPALHYYLYIVYMYNSRVVKLWMHKNAGLASGKKIFWFIVLYPQSIIHIKHSQHDDVIKWKHFPRHSPLVRGIHCHANIYFLRSINMMQSTQCSCLVSFCHCLTLVGFLIPYHTYFTLSGQSYKLIMIVSGPVEQPYWCGYIYILGAFVTNHNALQSASGT